MILRTILRLSPVKSIEFLYIWLHFLNNQKVIPYNIGCFTTLNKCSNNVFEQSLTPDQCTEAANIQIRTACSATCSYSFIYSSELKVEQAMQICSYYNFTFAAVGK